MTRNERYDMPTFLYICIVRTYLQRYSVDDAALLVLFLAGYFWHGKIANLVGVGRPVQRILIVVEYLRIKVSFSPTPCGVIDSQELPSRYFFHMASGVLTAEKEDRSEAESWRYDSIARRARQLLSTYIVGSLAAY